MQCDHENVFVPQDEAMSTRGDGLERVSYKIGDLGHVAPVTSSGANPEVSHRQTHQSHHFFSFTCSTAG